MVPAKALDQCFSRLIIFVTGSGTFCTILWWAQFLSELFVSLSFFHFQLPLCFCQSHQPSNRHSQYHPQALPTLHQLRQPLMTKHRCLRKDRLITVARAHLSVTKVARRRHQVRLRQPLLAPKTVLLHPLDSLLESQSLLFSWSLSLPPSVQFGFSEGKSAKKEPGCSLQGGWYTVKFWISGFNKKIEI